MSGDIDDFVKRLKAVLPSRWFTDQTPVLTGVLTGLASSWSWLYGLLGDVRAQLRIGTASGIFLDMIAADFFGTRLTRRTAQTDDGFRTAICKEIVRERGTRAALTSSVRDLTGRAPTIFEPARPADTGGYGVRGMTAGSGLGYGVAGGYGSLALPFQCFVTAYRPRGTGIANVAGWGAPVGAYGRGAVEYANLSMIAGQVTDADILTAVAAVLPANAIAWTRIGN